MQEFIRQKLSEDQDSSSENSECYEFIETEAQEGKQTAFPLKKSQIFNCFGVFKEKKTLLLKTATLFQITANQLGFRTQNRMIHQMSMGLVIHLFAMMK